MPLKILFITFCLIISFSASKADESKQEQIKILHEKIRKQELKLNALKAQLFGLQPTGVPLNTFQMSLTAKGVRIDDDIISDEKIRAKLKVIPTYFKILISCDDSVSQNELLSLMNLCKQYQLYNIVLNIGTKENPKEKQK